jgi:NAD(P)-dependent dehydrogenase (short-subunit alcohol dehydrogenase family)
VASRIASETGCHVRFVKADLGEVDDCRAVVAAADAAFGRVDILVNAAGITDRGDKRRAVRPRVRGQHPGSIHPDARVCPAHDSR